MPRPVGTIGETKLKILAIIHHHEREGNPAYGYHIWNTLKGTFHCYMDARDTRNVYRHLRDLSNRNLIRQAVNQQTAGAPTRQLYTITKEGRHLKSRFNRYLDLLTTTSQRIE